MTLKKKNLEKQLLLCFFKQFFKLFPLQKSDNLLFTFKIKLKKIISESPDFEEGDLPYLISFPPNANTPFREYMESITKAGMHYMQAITKITFDPKVAYAKPVCTVGSQHARMKDLLSARETAKEWVMREPFIPED